LGGGFILSTESVNVVNPGPEQPTSVFADLDKKQLFGLILGFVVMLAVHFAPTMSGLTPKGQSVLGVFLWFMIIMIFNSLHRFVVGLASPMFVVLL